MCSIHRSMCWQCGYFWNGETMPSITGCKWDPILKGLTMRCMFSGRCRWGQWDYVHKTQQAVDLAACCYKRLLRVLLCDTNQMIYACVMWAWQTGSLWLSLSVFIFCVSLQRSSCFPSSYLVVRHTPLSEAQNQPRARQSSPWGCVYLLEPHSSNPCLPNAVAKAY